MRKNGGWLVSNAVGEGATPKVVGLEMLIRMLEQRLDPLPITDDLVAEACRIYLAESACGMEEFSDKDYHEDGTPRQWPSPWRRKFSERMRNVLTRLTAHLTS